MQPAIILVLILLALTASILRRVYLFSSAKKLFGEELESKYQRSFTRISSNKSLVNGFFWFLTVVFFSISTVYLINYIQRWWAALILILALAVVFVYSANYQPGKFSINLAKLFAGLTARAVSPLKKYFGWALVFAPGLPDERASTLYDQAELADLLKKQLDSKDNAIDEQLIRRLMALIKKHNQTAGEVMVGLKQAKKVNSEAEIGPVLIDELHKTGRQYFLVEDKKRDELAGYIKLRDLTSLKKSGKIHNVTHRDLDYVESDEELFELVSMFLTSGSPLFLVRDHGETVGVVTIDDCLRELVAG